jgi:hypothetical protein
MENRKFSDILKRIIIHIFTCLLSSLKTNYKVNTSKEVKETNTSNKDKTLLSVSFKNNNSNHKHNGNHANHDAVRGHILYKN